MAICQIVMSRDSGGTHIIEIVQGEARLRVCLTPEQFARAVTSGWVDDARADYANLDLFGQEVERVHVTVSDKRLKSWERNRAVEQDVAVANRPDGEGWRHTGVSHTQSGDTITYYRALANKESAPTKDGAREGE